MSSKQFYEKYIKEELEKRYLPIRFEEVIKEYCIRANMDSKLPFLAAFWDAFITTPIKSTKNSISFLRPMVA